MLKHTILATTLCIGAMSTAFASPTNTHPVAYATPIAYATPLYTDSWTYDQTTPYHFTTRITRHKGFSNVYLEDGSVWKIEYSSDEKEVEKWLFTDALYLYKSPYSFSSTYQLHNTRRNTSVDAVIACSSDPLFTSYVEITAINTVEGVVTLFDYAGNGCDMEVPNSEVYLLKKWSIGDCIVLGWNKPSSWDSNPYHLTLINMNKSSSVRANRRIYLN